MVVEGPQPINALTPRINNNFFIFFNFKNRYLNGEKFCEEMKLFQKNRLFIFSPDRK